MDTLSFVLFGAGPMGRLHAGSLARHPRSRLELVVDPDEQRASELAAAHDCSWAPSLAAADISRCDAAIVAVPTADHVALSTELLDRGLHVLVEKPLAPNVSDATRLVEHARASGKTVAVGHVERFNPVVGELSRLVEDPLFVQIHRLSPYDGRVRDGVILDLMLHDLDLLQLVDDSPVVSLSAEAVSTRSQTEDLATCTMRLRSGLVCQLNASRVSQRKVRTLQVTMPDGVLDADLLLRTIQIARDTSGELVEEGTRRLRQRTVTEIPWITAGGEPLLLQLDDFLDAIHDQREPLVTPEQGLRAVELCEQVLAAAGLISDLVSS